MSKLGTDNPEGPAETLIDSSRLPRHDILPDDLLVAEANLHFAEAVDEAGHLLVDLLVAEADLPRQLVRQRLAEATPRSLELRYMFCACNAKWILFQHLVDG